MISRLRLFLLVAMLSCLGLLASCTPPSPSSPQPSPTLSAEEHAQRAENFVFHRDLEQAATEYQLAILADPLETAYYLRRAEILEILGRDLEARKTYTDALLDSAPNQDQSDLLHHRLILLLTLKLAEPQEAAALLPHLPEGAFLYVDASGALALARGQIALALDRFTLAQHLGRDNDEQALALYHVALAYHLLNDEKSTSVALYYAINLAENAALIRDIERLWELVSTP
ncbi:hypothetical protein [Geoalkalibacter halelectricus]|uniref:hypothetical protein n=1 Tax=Geoalkalibacter halelectricus TaxID=2847045 RepID=UPI003D212EA9